MNWNSTLPMPLFAVLNAFRYALGRQSYAQPEMLDWLASQWASLPVELQTMIMKEAREEVSYRSSKHGSSIYITQFLDQVADAN
jgi:hypothetical protein